jgi:hypothetical protein
MALRYEIIHDDELAVALAVLHLKLDLDSGMSAKEAYLSYSLSPDQAERMRIPSSTMVQTNPDLSSRSSRYNSNMFVIGGAGDLVSYYGIEQLPDPRFGRSGGLCSHPGGCRFERGATWLP